MTDETKTDAPETEAEAAEENGDDAKSKRARMGDGIRQGIGVLSAFKEALEETIQEARDRGDLSAERAKEVMKEALDKAQNAAEEAKGKLDFARQNELDDARAELEALRAGFEALRMRVEALEQTAFGESKGE